MYYVYWLEIISCMLVCCVQCHPYESYNSMDCDEHSAECRYAMEQRMHSVILTRSKRENDRAFHFNDDENSSSFWIKRAQKTVHEHVKRKYNKKVAKNVIFFLGDGMSIPTYVASRIYMGQSRGERGESTSLEFEKFPYVGLSKTYCVDKQVADSACTATAYLCGVKANYKTIGVNANVALNDCKAASKPQNQVNSLLAYAQRAGKATGFATTTTVTNASPAGLYAHTSNRHFECDGDVERIEMKPGKCPDIAHQLVTHNPGKNINVIFGGGRTKFIPKSMQDVDGFDGERLDGKNLISEWQKNKNNAKVIYDKESLRDLDVESTDYVLGLFASGHMDYHLESDHTKQPRLLEMTEAAIKILQKEDNGFFLFVEGGRIDHGHHEAQAMKALDETVEFSEAIKKAVEMTSRNDTLIVVTSDHAHTMSVAGYPDRGNPILGLNTIKSDVDGKPSLTLSYANGPGYYEFFEEDGSRKNLTGLKPTINFTYPSTYPTSVESHGGDDVGVFALGCYAHLFTGSYEQNLIPHLINYASCMGDGITACNDKH